MIAVTWRVVGSTLSLGGSRRRSVMAARAPDLVGGDLGLPSLLPLCGECVLNSTFHV